MKQRTNPKCPDYMAHQENAADLLFPYITALRSGVILLTPEQSEMVDAHAEIEYLNCEGH